MGKGKGKNLFQRIGRALSLYEDNSFYVTQPQAMNDVPQSPDDVTSLYNITVEKAGAIKQVSLHVEETGKSGTENYSGYYSEEYLQTLRGKAASLIWDKMRRSDPKIRMVLNATKNPIKSAQWEIQSAGSDPDSEKHAALVRQVLFKDLEQSWIQTLSEILTYIDFGHSVFEVIHKVVLDDPALGSYNSIKKLAFRSQKTLERWNLDHQTGKIISIYQQAFGDLGVLVNIPGEFLMVFTNEKEGDNYQGVSMLRPVYGPWKRKNDTLKQIAIGNSKFAVPTPVMDVPAGKENTAEYHNAKNVLENYASNERQYIMKPAGWALAFNQSVFDSTRLRADVSAENAEIAFAFLANFLELGQSGSGSWALSSDLSDFFLSALVHVAGDICENFNRGLIPDLVKLNFGAQKEYPKLICSGIDDKAGKELAECMKYFGDGKYITPDEDLENNLREKYHLPKKSKATVQANQLEQAQLKSDISSTQSTSLVEQINSFRMAEAIKNPKALIGAKADELQVIMQAMLQDIGVDLIADLMAKKKASNPSQYLKIITQVTPRGSRDYKTILTDFLAETSSMALRQVRREIPAARDVKLVEKLNTLSLAENFFDLLPASVQKLITSQVGLLSVFQIQDLTKVMYFQFNNSVLSTDSDTILEADLKDTLDNFLSGASVAAGAGNTVSKLVNESRSAFFFDEDVTDEIESFTFVNGDPVSPICQDLAGTVFAKDDPNMDRYSPPLHHNCKSYIVANLKGSNKEVDPTGLTPSKASLDEYITLSELNKHSYHDCGGHSHV